MSPEKKQRGPAAKHTKGQATAQRGTSPSGPSDDDLEEPAGHGEAHSSAGERDGGRASRGRGRHGNEEPGGATAGVDRKMNNEPLEREPLDGVRARSEALLKANAAPRCGAR